MPGWKAARHVPEAGVEERVPATSDTRVKSQEATCRFGLRSNDRDHNTSYVHKRQHHEDPYVRQSDVGTCAVHGSHLNEQLQDALTRKYMYVHIYTHTHTMHTHRL